MSTRPLRRIRITSAILPLILIVGCGGSDDGASDNNDSSNTTTGVSSGPANTTTQPTAPDTSDLLDPCSLLSSADIEAVTGVSFGEGTFNESLSNENQLICDWISSGDEFATAQVLVLGIGGAFETAKAGASGAFTIVDVDIPGAADAYATEEGSLVGMDIGGIFVQVAYIPSGPGNVLAETTQLATVAASNA